MTTTHRIGTSIALALALALAASAAPAGARPFDLNANDSYVPAGSASMQAPSQPAATPTSTQPRSKIANTGPCSEACSGGGYDSSVEPPGRYAHEHRAGFRCLKHQRLRLRASPAHRRADHLGRQRL